VSQDATRGFYENRISQKKTEVEGKTIPSIVDSNFLNKSYRMDNGQICFLLFADILMKTEVAFLLLVSFDQLY
jgi:hypothetical protein